MGDERTLEQDLETLWRSELAALAEDAELREALAMSLAMWRRALEAGDERPEPGRDGHAAAARQPAGPDEAARPQAAAAAPDAGAGEGDGTVADLRRRVAELERELGRAAANTAEPGGPS